MGDLLKSRGRRLSGGWFSFWAAVLLILPNCTFSASGLSPVNNFDAGTPPRTSAIFCDIEMARRCATPEDLAMGTRLASAAVALVAGQPGTTIGIDDSPAALSVCGGGPVAVVFEGTFPQGLSTCVNCGETIPVTYPDANVACQTRCHDLFGATSPDGSFLPTNPPTADTIAFCAANARASTNFPLNGCFADACTMEGTLRLDFLDPRRIPEPVEWINLAGVTASGGSLQRTAPETGQYDAGASSSVSQLIAGGDAYFEVTATETDRARLGGLSSGPAPVGGITLNDIGFGVLLEVGELFVFESGGVVSSFGAYASGDKFRVKLRDNFDGTATVAYTRLIGPCVDGSPCSEATFHTSTNLATYPVRVDALFRTFGATLTDARIVRIR